MKLSLQLVQKKTYRGTTARIRVAVQGGQWMLAEEVAALLQDVPLRKVQQLLRQMWSTGDLERRAFAQSLPLRPATVYRLRPSKAAVIDGTIACRLCVGYAAELAALKASHRRTLEQRAQAVAVLKELIQSSVYLRVGFRESIREAIAANEGEVRP